MKLNKSQWLNTFVYLGLGIILLTFVAQYIAQQSRMATFGRYGGGENMRQSRQKRTPGEEKAFTQRQKAFFEIWNMRHRRTIDLQLFPFLEDKEEFLRQQAVRALGRLESKPALPKLQTIKNRMASVRQKGKKVDVTRVQWEAARPVPDFTLDLAIARIKSRGQTGQRKLDTILKGIGLEWRDIPDITRRAWYISDGTQPPPRFPATPNEKALLREIIDVLYLFKAKGQDITPWTNQLSLAPAESTWLSTASMPRQKALQTLLNYLSKISIVRSQEYTLSRSIYLAMGPEALPPLRQKLEHLVNHPNPRKQRQGTVQLIRAVAYIGDRQSIPILKKFAKDKDSHIRSEARDSIKHIERGDFFVPSPF